MEHIALLLIPLAAVALMALPFTPFCRKLSRRGRLMANLGLFALVLVLSVCGPLSGYLLADAPADVVTDANAVAAPADNGAGWAYIAAALATGIGSVAAGIAVAAAAPAAIGALAEDGSTFGKSMIFVGLGEGLAIFGLLVSILILNKV